MNKITNEVHLSSLKTLAKIVPNGSNLPFQIKWGDNLQPVQRTHGQSYEFLVKCYKMVFIKNYFSRHFTKLSQNYLEVRYAGGSGYETKKKDSVELINYMAESLYSTLQENNNYSVNETRRISEILTKHKSLLLSVKTYESFTNAYPDIELYIDLRNDPRIVESNYSNIKEIQKQFFLFHKAFVKN